MTMADQSLMFAATGFYFICHVPELYANYVNKNANMYNMPEKLFMLLGTVLAVTYAIQLGDSAILTNYGLQLGIDVVALTMRGYYVWLNYFKTTGNATVAVASDPEISTLTR